MIDIRPPAAPEAGEPVHKRVQPICRQKGAQRLPKRPLLRDGNQKPQTEDGVMANMSERDRLLSLLFDRNDKTVKNIKFFRGNAADLTVEEMCQTSREVIEDTWTREGFLTDAPPTANMG